MPKTENTRAQRAAKLLALVERGPYFADPTKFGGQPLTVQEVERQYRAWAEAWVLPELKTLVPELRHSNE